MSATDDLFDLSAAPMRVGAVRLRVRDLEAVFAFYQRVLGLARLSGDRRSATLGGATPLLHLDEDPALAPGDPRQAGLFHTAFLMPSRADLARWLAHARAAGVALQGASDHIVSEAIYLSDPEGNGIEVYADRPVSRWRGADGEIQMATRPLDAPALLAAAGETSWSGFPAAGTIGHVHLQVGDTEDADAFYRDLLGFDVAARYPGASFYGAGGYHHQFAGNVWNSARAGRRPKGVAGLAEVEIIVRDASRIADVAARAEQFGVAPVTVEGGVILHDPWGVVIKLRAVDAFAAGAPVRTLV